MQKVQGRLPFGRRWPTHEAELAAPVKFNLCTRPPVNPPSSWQAPAPNTPAQLLKTLSTHSQNQPIVPRISNNPTSGLLLRVFPRSKTYLQIYWHHPFNFDFLHQKFCGKLCKTAKIFRTTWRDLRPSASHHGGDLCAHFNIFCQISLHVSLREERSGWKYSWE